MVCEIVLSQCFCLRRFCIYFEGSRGFLILSGFGVLVGEMCWSLLFSLVGFVFIVERDF